MFLIFKRESPCDVVKFNSLDDIKIAVENKAYGEYNYDDKTKTYIKNKFENFKIIKKIKFPYVLCNGSSNIKNIILDVGNSQKTYYLLREHHYAHGVWDWP